MESTIPLHSLGINHIGIAGAGAWGSALAQVAAHSGRKVTLWSRSVSVVHSIQRTGENSQYLPGVQLSKRINATDNVQVLHEADVVLLACPAQSLRQVLPLVGVDAPVMICAKGIERETGLLMHEVAREVNGRLAIGILSGPGFAGDVVQGLPCAVTIGMADVELATKIGSAIGSQHFRPYASSDVTGVATGGAVKNVLAIACGVVEGLKLGESARAALTTRGFAEMVRFGLALGARFETLTGLSGLGDLILTASSLQSRNFALGVRLAQGPVEGFSGVLAEGVASSGALVMRAKKLGVAMPIAEAVAEIVAGRLAVGDAIDRLLSRPFRSET